MKRWMWTASLGVACATAPKETAGTSTTDTTAAVPEGPTYARDIAPILASRCTSCHSEGNLAPFALDTYADASLLAEAVAGSVESGAMPPWFAIETDDCTPMLPFKDDLRLSDEEIGLLRAWADAGAPEGDPASAADLPASISLSIENPTLEIPFPVDYTVDGEADQLVCFVLDPQVTEMQWVTEIQLVAGNAKVDHHGLIVQDVNGELADGPEVFDCFNAPSVPSFLMNTWTPGAVPMKTPETSAMPLYPGSRLVVQMHYHPSADGPEVDRSTVQLVFSNEQPEWAAAQALIGNDSRQSSDGSGLQPGPDDTTSDAEFVIPAGARGHTETILYVQDFPIRVPLFSVGTHMHYVGTDMQIDYLPRNDESREECLIDTPWDFNWQRTYSFDVPIDELPKMGPGDALRLTCTYDNSMDNPAVRDALAEQGLTEPQDVRLGESTLDEMCLGLFGILIPPDLVGELF